MKTYSQDLRDRTLRALETGEETQPEIAERFGVSLSFVEKLWNRWRTTGLSAAKPHAGRQARRLIDHLDTLRRRVDTQPDATLEELRLYIIKAKGPDVSPATICRELQRLNLPVKKSPSTLLSEIPHVSRSCGSSSAKK
jgi:transposase